MTTRPQWDQQLRLGLYMGSLSSSRATWIERYKKSEIVPAEQHLLKTFIGELEYRIPRGIDRYFNEGNLNMPVAGSLAGKQIKLVLTDEKGRQTCTAIVFDLTGKEHLSLESLKKEALDYFIAELSRYALSEALMFKLLHNVD